MACLALNHTSDDAKELVRLCRAGRLYEVERWIAAGRPLDLPVAKRKTLLQIAVETEFHSLIELIVRCKTNQASKNAALSDSVSRRRLDFVELLVQNGAQITSVPLADVLLTWEPKLIQFFLYHGADPIIGSPFAVAFGAKVRTALRPFIEYKQAHPDLATALGEQPNIALRYFCSKGDMKWTSLMLWAGADARSLGPTLGEKYPTDPDCYVSGIQEACYAGNVEVLKKLKPEAGRDNLENLLHCATVSGRRDAIRHLLGIGANPNDKANGGSSALDTCIWHLGFPSFNHHGGRHLKTRYEVSNDVDNIRELVERGAVWKPDNPYSINAVRRSLYECEPNVTLELLRVLLKYDACPVEQAQVEVGGGAIQEA